jgi:hypothetical protein
MNKQQMELREDTITPLNLYKKGTYNASDVITMEINPLIAD